MERSTPNFPAWVQKRDGRLVPFEADKINRAIFAAAEGAGQADPFLARELSDGVLHFLAAEADSATVLSSQIEEIVAKVVRELGHPKIAQAFADYRKSTNLVVEAGPAASFCPDTFGPSEQEIISWITAGILPPDLAKRSATVSLERFSLEHVYSRNLAAAQRNGLLQIGGLDAPLELAAAVIRPGQGGLPGLAPSGSAGGWRSPGIFEAVEHSRHYVSQSLALDAPERDLAGRGLRIAETFTYFRELELAARTTGLQVVLNLGSAAPPDWAKELVPGPLFVDQRQAEGYERVTGHLDALIDQVLQQPTGDALHLNWHLADRDFSDLSGRRRLTRLARAALTGAPITFVCDRPRQPVSLAEGLDRRRPAVLLWVGLNLPGLLQRASGRSDPDDYLKKLMSLARLAASAGVQKREFLRRHARRDRPTFLLDHSHLAIHLSGLSELLQSLFGNNEHADESVQTFIVQMLRHLHETLGRETRGLHLECLIDEKSGATSAADPAASDDLAAAWKQRLVRAGQEHAVCGRGTAQLPAPADGVFEPAEFLDLLHFGWKHTAVCRIRIQFRKDAKTQLTAGWS